MEFPVACGVSNNKVLHCVVQFVLINVVNDFGCF